MFSWLKYRSSFISRSVRKQNMEWSKGVIFLMATFCPEGLWTAELFGNGQTLQDSNWQRRPAKINLPHDAVGAFTNDILDVVLFAHVERDLPRPALILCVTHGCWCVSSLRESTCDFGWTSGKQCQLNKLSQKLSPPLFFLPSIR